MTARDELLSLLQNIFDTSIQLHASDSTELPAIYSTPSLILKSAQSASLTQIADLVLHLLLSHPPFAHSSPAHWNLQTFRLLTAWGAPRLHNDRNALSPYDCLCILNRQRLEFQRVNEKGFGLVASLLLACLKLLSPDSANRRTNGRSWMECHGKAVSVMAELLYGIPNVNWEELDTHAQFSKAVWECLRVLCVGAPWWSREDTVFRENMLQLAKNFFGIPTVSSVLRASMRIDMDPSDVHQIVTTLLETLEKRMGVPEPQPVNAFTPTPLSFPILSNLDRHVFTNDFEFSSLRVLFVTWLTALSVHRNTPGCINPWKMQAVLQHTEAAKRLEAHPSSGMRVALIYIFNEMELGSDTFKPATDLKAIELLKKYISHRAALTSGTATPKTFRSTSSATQLQQSPESCITVHAEWTLPWLWRRRATDNDFVLVITSAWLISTCSRIGKICPEHPSYEIVLRHAESAFEVFHDFFRFMFSIDFVNKSADVKSTLKRIRTLYKVVMGLSLLVATEKPVVLNQRFVMLTIRCCVNSLDSEWIPLEGWSQTCEVLCKVSKTDLTDATKLAQIVMAMEPIVPTILYDMEIITDYCNRISIDDDISAETLATLMTKLTHQVHFLTILSAAHSPLRNQLSRKPHLLISTIHYVTTSYSDILTASEKSELAWLHAASVAALIEFLIVVDFGILDSGSSTTPAAGPSEETQLMESKDKQEDVGRIIKCIIARNFEMSYVTAALCRLAVSVAGGYWERNPFLYLETAIYLRNVLLDEETHKWCKLLPAITDAFTSLLDDEATISQTFHSSRWNLSLCTRLFTLLLSSTKSTTCSTCPTNLFPHLTTLLKLFLSPHPPWQSGLLLESGLGRYSILEFAVLEKKFKQLAEEEQLTDANRILEVCECFPNWDSKTKLLRRTFERNWRGKYGKSWKSRIGKVVDVVDGGDGKSEGKGKEGWYRIWRPVEGVPGVLVPC